MTVLNIEGNDLVWSPAQQKLYVAVPSNAGTNANTITVVDPIAGSIVSSQQLSSPASELAVSDNGQFLYAVTNSGTQIQRFVLPALTPDIQWSLPTDPIFGPDLATDIKVQPGAAHTLAVAMGVIGMPSVAIFDDAVERPSVAVALLSVGNTLQWNAAGTELYSVDTNSSSLGLYTMTINASGAGSVVSYPSSFRTLGIHLHSDPATGFVYNDSGEVVNATTGIPVGSYRYTRSVPTSFPGPLSVVDPALQRFFILAGIIEPNGSSVYQIQSFDQTHFDLLSTMVIPDTRGQIANFVQWGRAGLAFVTVGSPTTQGQLYILDGSFVNATGTPDTSVGTQLNLMPTLTAISPITATINSSAVTLTVSGHDFMQQSVVYWNGNPLSTTLVNDTELSAEIPASDLTTSATAAITASNPDTGPAVSNSMSFSVNPAPSGANKIAVFNAGGNDLVWDSTTSKIYVSVPGSQGDSGDAIAIVDPVAGTIANSGFVGSDPNRLSLSDGGEYLYLGLDGQNSIAQLALPNLNVNAAWNLGGIGTFEGPYSALDVEAAPGAPQTTAVTLANLPFSPSPAAVAIYDGSTQRPNLLQITQYPYSSLQWVNGSSALYAVDQQVAQDFFVLGVGPSGAVLDQHYNQLLNPYSVNIHYDAGTGLVYADAGQVIQPSNGTIVGNYGSSGIAVPDSTMDRIFILGQTAAQNGTSNYTIESFDQTAFTPVNSITIQNVVGTPTALIRWGNDGLAFTTRVGTPADFIFSGPGQLYVVSGNFVTSSDVIQPSRRSSLLPVHRTWGLRASPAQRPRPR